MSPALKCLYLALWLLLGLLSACGSDEPVTPLPTTLELAAPSRLEVGTAAGFGIRSALQGPDLQWRWNFGDGQSSTEAVPQHRYVTPGRYTVTLSLRNGARQLAEGTHAVQAGAFARLEGRDCTGGPGTGWCFMVPSAAARAVHDVHVLESGAGVAVGELGHVAITQDGGASWQVQPPAVGETLGLVRMADAQQVWAVATVTSRLLRSRDGGRSWQPVSSLPLQTVRGLWATSAGVVVISGLGPGLSSASWVSSDGGANWRRSACEASGLSAGGTLWGAGGRWVSHDLGLSCRPVWTDEATSVLGASLVDDSAVGILTATTPFNSITTVYQRWSSSDGGRSFSVSPATFPPLPPDSWAADLQLGRDGRGIGRILRTGTAAGPAESISTLVTGDAGRSWRLVEQALPFEVDSRTQASAYADERALWFRVTDINAKRQRQGLAWVLNADEPRVLVVRVPGETDSPFDLRRTASGSLLAGFGEGRALRWYSSTDAGRSWVTVPGSAGAEPDVDSGGVWFFDIQQGLWLRGDGVLLATGDGGRSWQQRAVLGSGFAHSLAFTPDGIGWVLAGGQLHRSADRGHRWQPVAGPGGPLGITQQRFVDARTGWVAASRCTVSGNIAFCEGRLHRTQDGGQSWTELPAGNINEYTPMAFADAQRGAWIDQNGLVRHTRDGGNSWAPAQVDRPLNQPGAALHFDRQGRGWLLPKTDRSRLLRSLDGGATWQSMALPEVAGLPWLSAYSSISFGDSRHGWLVGSGGVLLASQDGGDTWRQQTLGTERATYEVFAVDGSTAWVAGSFPATLLSTSTGGN